MAGISRVASESRKHAAIAQPRLFLLLQELFEREAEIGHGLLGRLPDAQAHEVVAELWPDEEFRREIGHGAHRLGEVGVRGVNPAVQQAVTHDVRKGQVVVVRRGDLAELRLMGEELLLEVALDGLGVETEVDVVVGQDTGLDLGLLHGGQPLYRTRRGLS